MAAVVHIPWYATLFRGDTMERDINEIAAISLRYGARAYWVYRAQDDRYKFMQLVEFDNHVDWERYWEGPEMIEFRVLHAGHYQVPLQYGWLDVTAHGAINGAPERVGAPLAGETP